MTEQTRQRVILGLGSLFGLALVLFIIFDIDFGNSPDDVSNKGTINTQNNTEAAAELTGSEEKPAFDLVRISRGGTGVIAGRMVPGSLVELFANGEKVSEVTADESGEWVIILDEPLQTGSVELTLKARGPESLNAAEADNVVVVSVPEREGERFVEKQENGVVAVLSPKSGEGASRVLQKPGAAAFAEVGDSLRVDTVDYGGGSAVVTGRALPRVELRIYLDGTFITAVRADDNGKWELSLENDITSGEHVIRLDQTLSGGDVQLRIEQPFVAGEGIDQTIAEGGVIVKPGNTLWQIARRLYGSGFRYTLIFRENSEQIKDPDLIFPGQVFKLPANGESR